MTTTGVAPLVFDPARGGGGRGGGAHGVGFVHGPWWITATVVGAAAVIVLGMRFYAAYLRRKRDHS